MDMPQVLLCAQVGGTFWLSRLARDREATVRAAAWSILARLALPAAPATRRMLLQSWPDCGTTAVRVSLPVQGAGLLSVCLPHSDAAPGPTVAKTSACRCCAAQVALSQREPYAVRAGALCFLSAALAETSEQARRDVQSSWALPLHQPSATTRPWESHPAGSSRIAPAVQADNEQTSLKGVAGSLLADPASPNRQVVGSPAEPPGLGRGRQLQQPTLEASLRHSMAGASNSPGANSQESQHSARQQHFGQDVWDFGVEQLLLQGTFWGQVPALLQVGVCKPAVLRASWDVAVLLLPAWHACLDPATQHLRCTCIMPSLKVIASLWVLWLDSAACTDASAWPAGQCGFAVLPARCGSSPSAGCCC